MHYQKQVSTLKLFILLIDPLISESDLIYLFLNNTVVKGSVKRMFIGDENYFIGAEFVSEICTVVKNLSSKIIAMLK